MSISFSHKFLATCTLGFMVTIAIAGGPPVKLDIESAKSTGGLALLSESGWPLTIEMVVDFPEDENEQFPAYAVQPNYPVRGRWGFLIFDDPDGCLNPPAPFWNVQFSTECGYPDPLPDDWVEEDWIKPESDEVYMEFWPDVDMAGVEDLIGNEDRQADLLDSAESRGPEFQKWGAADCIPGDNDVYDVHTNEDGGCIRFGPQTGGEVMDGFGFGADDDITGLVIIAEYGVGRVFDEPDFELSDPIGAVNLAGLVNSVSYDLSVLKEKSTKPVGEKGKPTTPIITEQARIWAHMNMELNVVRHLFQYDGCTGVITWPDDEEDGENMYPNDCDGNDLWRIDGGPAVEPPYKFMFADAASIYLLEDTTYTLKAFLVAGQAPNMLFDGDDDGDVDSADAVIAGYTLLSNQDSISLLQLSKNFCSGGGGGSYEWDLDGNGVASLTYICPPSPGTVSRPPR